VSSEETRCGFVAVIGRPNVGKSTLINSIVGEKVSITSDKVQTTRRSIRGVKTADNWQLVLTDLPGIQRPMDQLTRRMQGQVDGALKECDSVLLVLNAREGVGPGDRFAVKMLKQAGVPVVVALNKIDTVKKPKLLPLLQEVDQLGLDSAVVPISAIENDGVDELVKLLAKSLPKSPFHYPSMLKSDLSEEVAVAELVREQVLHNSYQEVPHAVEVIVTDISQRESDLIDVEAMVVVDTESQKGILVGSKGAKIKSIGSGARAEIERRLGQRVYLDLKVSVSKGWRRNRTFLDSIGID